MEAAIRTPVTIALVNDYDIVVMGIAHILEQYQDRVVIAERDTTGMLGVMKAMRVTGPGRSLWISVMDLNARSVEVRYFKEFDRKYEFRFAEPALQQ